MFLAPLKNDIIHRRKVENKSKNSILKIYGTIGCGVCYLYNCGCCCKSKRIASPRSRAKTLSEISVDHLASRDFRWDVLVTREASREASRGAKLWS